MPLPPLYKYLVVGPISIPTAKVERRLVAIRSRSTLMALEAAIGEVQNAHSDRGIKALCN